MSTVAVPSLRLPNAQVSLLLFVVLAACSACAGGVPGGDDHDSEIASTTGAPDHLPNPDDALSDSGSPGASSPDDDDASSDSGLNEASSSDSRSSTTQGTTILEPFMSSHSEAPDSSPPPSVPPRPGQKTPRDRTPPRTPPRANAPGGFPPPVPPRAKTQRKLPPPPLPATQPPDPLYMFIARIDEQGCLESALKCLQERDSKQIDPEKIMEACLSIPYKDPAAASKHLSTLCEALTKKGLPQLQIPANEPCAHLQYFGPPPIS